MNQFKTTTQVAELFNCDAETVRKLIRRKALESVNLGSKERPNWRITEDAINKFIKQGGITND